MLSGNFVRIYKHREDNKNEVNIMERKRPAGMQR